MRRFFAVRSTLAAIAIAAVCAPAAAAQVAPPGVEPAGTNDAGGFRNILGVGQGETISEEEFGLYGAGTVPPPTFVNQRDPGHGHVTYTGLVAAAPHVTKGNIGDFFKPAGFGVPAGEIDSSRTEVIPVPNGGTLTIVRDRTYEVPHVYGSTRRATLYGAGYASAEDRLFLMDALRHMGRGNLSELIGPGADDSNIKADAETLKTADYSEEELQRQIDTAAHNYGREGRQVKQDLLDYTDGINAYITQAKVEGSPLRPVEYTALGKPAGLFPEYWKPTDTVAVASLIGGIFGLGGGQEVTDADILHKAIDRFGKHSGRQVFNDFAETEDPEAPVKITKPFHFDGNPNVDESRKGAAFTDFGSFKARDPIESSGGVVQTSAQSSPRWAQRLGSQLREALAPGQRREASNATLVSAKNSQSGHPIAVTGPQVGYYSPEILNELDLHGPGFDARGAAFPGISLYILIGRGRDFSWTATSATSDNVDLFAERLCNRDGSKPSRSSDHYEYKGKCIPFLERTRTLNITTNPTEQNPPQTVKLKIERSVHGPIQGTATVDGKPVAISKARSTYMHEVDSALAFERLNTNQVHGPASFNRVMSQINFVFNWFYNDDRHIAYITSGWYPRRGDDTDRHLPTWGTGKYDWRGFDPGSYTSNRIARDDLPQTIDPSRGYIVSWNNKQAPDWQAADDIFAYGSVHRSQRLEKRVREGLRNGGKLSLPDLVGIMGDAATVDLRGQEDYPVLREAIGRSDDPDVRKALKILDDWTDNGAHRRDKDLDGFYDEPKGVVLMDAWWNRLVRRMFEPELGGKLVAQITRQLPFDQPPGPGGSAYFSGWYGYVDKDLRTLMDRHVEGRFSRRYCGHGKLGACRDVLVSSLKRAFREAEDKYGKDLENAKVRSVDCEGQDPCDQIEFTAAGAVGTDPIPWQDRGTFQQATEVQGHR